MVDVQQASNGNTHCTHSTIVRGVRAKFSFAMFDGTCIHVHLPCDSLYKARPCAHLLMTLWCCGFLLGVERVPRWVCNFACDSINENVVFDGLGRAIIDVGVGPISYVGSLSALPDHPRFDGVCAMHSKLANCCA